MKRNNKMRKEFLATLVKVTISVELSIQSKYIDNQIDVNGKRNQFVKKKKKKELNCSLCKIILKYKITERLTLTE